MSFPWNCSSSQQPFEDRFTAESVLAHTVSCPLTQLSGGVFVKLFKASCREMEGGGQGRHGLTFWKLYVFTVRRNLFVQRDKVPTEYVIWPLI